MNAKATDVITIVAVQTARQEAQAWADWQETQELIDAFYADYDEEMKAYECNLGR